MKIKYLNENKIEKYKAVMVFNGELGGNAGVKITRWYVLTNAKKFHAAYFSREGWREGGKSRRQSKVIVIAWEIIFNCEVVFCPVLREKPAWEAVGRGEGREREYNYTNDRLDPSIKIY